MARLLAVLALMMSVFAPAGASWAGSEDGRSLENRVEGTFSDELEVLVADTAQGPDTAAETLLIIYDLASGSGLFLQRDPEGYRDSVNLYAGFANDPVNLRDPSGRSTWINEDGCVFDVRNDGDLSIYQVPDGATIKLGGETLRFSPGCPGESGLPPGGFATEQLPLSTISNKEKVGETRWWDSFISPESGTAVGRIFLGRSLDKMFWKRSMLGLTATTDSQAGMMLIPGGSMDLKTQLPGHRSFHGFLFKGKYVSLRDLGNILAGFVARGRGIPFDVFQKRAGALHAGGLDSLLAHEMTGVTYGEAPTYGEFESQRSRSWYGYSFMAADIPRWVQLRGVHVSQWYSMGIKSP